MKENIVTYKVAQTLYSLGFDEICKYGYCVHDDKIELMDATKECARALISNSMLRQYLIDTLQEEEGNGDIMAPTYTQAWIWLWNNNIVRIMPQEKKCVVKWKNGEMSFKVSSDDVEEIIAGIIDILYGEKNIDIEKK